MSKWQSKTKICCRAPLVYGLRYLLVQFTEQDHFVSLLGAHLLIPTLHCIWTHIRKILAGAVAAYLFGIYDLLDVIMAGSKHAEDPYKTCKVEGILKVGLIV